MQLQFENYIGVNFCHKMFSRANADCSCCCRNAFSYKLLFLIFFFFWLVIVMTFHDSLTVKLLFYFIDIYVLTEILNIRRLKAGPARKKKYILYNPYLWIILENIFLF